MRKPVGENAETPKERRGRERAMFATWGPAARMGCIAAFILLLGLAVVLAYFFPIWR